VIVSVTNALSPAENALYLEAQVQAGPFLALAGSLALAAGAWVGRPEQEQAADLSPPPSGTARA
jgi:hypothetical protein